MEILLPCGRGANPSRPERWDGGLEWWINPEIGGVDSVPPAAKILHLGDLRFPDVGDLTCRLRERVRELAALCQVCPQIEGVVIHAESALGWEGGCSVDRRGFWEFLVGAFSGGPEVFVENNVLLREGSRYDFIRDPGGLAEEIGEFGLRLALDTAHAAWYYQGWPPGAFDLVGDPIRVGHLHLGDWAPGEGPGRQHLRLGEGTLPVDGILRAYRGSFVTLEVREGFSESLRFVREIVRAR